MSERRQRIDTILKGTCVPLLRERGFQGSYPHFRPVLGKHIDLLTFQFRSDGSSFIVEISYADPERRNVGFRTDAPVSKIDVACTSERYRLGAKARTTLDGEWLPLSHGILTSDDRHFRRLALKVNDMVINEAEPWWESKRMTPNTSLERTREG
jgi:hypothetical protein